MSKITIKRKLLFSRDGKMLINDKTSIMVIYKKMQNFTAALQNLRLLIQIGLNNTSTID